MKIVVALDSFKGSCSASQACRAVSSGIKRVHPDTNIISCPISDGGEGFIATLEPILLHKGYHKHSLEVMGPYQDQVKANFLYHEHKKEAIVEMAQCSGLELDVHHIFKGHQATTYGLGQLIDHVINLGATSIKIGLGGSATNDAGAGWAQALGAKFFDLQGHLIKQPLCGALLEHIGSVDTTLLDAKLQNITIEGTCDVTNPLTGPKGATYIFGPQKGVPHDNLAALDKTIQNFAKLMNEHYHQEQDQVPGSGAAGGMGAALLWFAHAKLKRGIDVVMQTLELEQHIQDSDLVIVGEGRIDGQSIHGKAPVGVAYLAQQHQVPVIALCGSLGPDYEKLYDYGINALFAISSGPMSLEESMARAPELLTNISTNLMRTLSLAFKG